LVFAGPRQNIRSVGSFFLIFVSLLRSDHPQLQPRVSFLPQPLFEPERLCLNALDVLYREYKNTLTPHVLRHGYATMLYDAGVDAFTAQKLLGHAHIETTLAVYTHLSQRKKDESIQKLTAYVKNGYTTKQSKKSAKNKEIA